MLTIPIQGVYPDLSILQCAKFILSLTKKPYSGHAKAKIEDGKITQEDLSKYDKELLEEFREYYKYHASKDHPRKSDQAILESLDQILVR